MWFDSYVKAEGTLFSTVGCVMTFTLALDTCHNDRNVRFLQNEFYVFSEEKIKPTRRST